jgi:chloramphenicol-sensitive protein RarD
MFLLAISVYGEQFSINKAVTFIFIWGALVVFSFDGIRNSRKKKNE